MTQTTWLKLVHPRTPAEREDCRIGHRAVCALCGPEKLTALDRINSCRTYTHGQEIIATGKEMPFGGSAVTGFVSLKRVLADGRRQMVGLLFPSDFLGRPGDRRDMLFRQPVAARSGGTGRGSPGRPAPRRLRLGGAGRAITNIRFR